MRKMRTANGVENSFSAAVFRLHSACGKGPAPEPMRPDRCRPSNPPVAPVEKALVSPERLHDPLQPRPAAFGYISFRRVRLSLLSSMFSAGLALSQGSTCPHYHHNTIIPQNQRFLPILAPLFLLTRVACVPPPDTLDGSREVLPWRKRLGRSRE